MSTIKDIFLELVNTLGFSLALIIIVALIVLIVLFKKLFPFMLKEIENYVRGRNARQLENNVVFQRLNHYQILVQGVKTTCPIRKAIYLDLMTERIRLLQEDLKRFIATDLSKYSKAELQVEIFNLLDTVRIKFLTYCNKQGIPEPLMHRIDEIVFANREYTMSQIKVFCFSDYLYRNNYARMGEILNTICLAASWYMGAFEKVLESLNGDISTLNYKGISCRKCKVCVHDKFLKRQKEE